MKITLIRHGQTDWNVVDKIQGQLQVPLNEKGRHQAKEVSKLIDPTLYDYVLTSKLIRAKETSKIIFPNKNIIEHEELNERNFGEWHEKYWKDILNEYSEMEHPWSKAAQHIKPLNGESLYEFIIRSRKDFIKIINQYPINSSIVIVFHGGNIKSIISMILGDWPWNLNIPPSSNCDVIEIEYVDKIFKIIK